MTLAAKSEQGATFVEYALAVGILFVVFLVAGTLLRRAGEERGQAAQEVVSSGAPCWTDNDTTRGLGGNDECL